MVHVVHVWVHVPVGARVSAYAYTQGGQRSTKGCSSRHCFLKPGPSPWSLAGLLGWWASKPLGSTGAPFSSPGTIGMCHHTQIFHMSSGDRTWVLRLARSAFYWVNYLTSLSKYNSNSDTVLTLNKGKEETESSFSAPIFKLQRLLVPFTHPSLCLVLYDLGEFSLQNPFTCYYSTESFKPGVIAHTSSPSTWISVNCRPAMTEHQPPVSAPLN